MLFERPLPIAVAAALVPYLIIVLVYFPWDTDRPLTAAQAEKNRAYYTAAYTATPEPAKPASEYEARYEAIARAAAEEQQVVAKVTAFVAQYGLRNRPVLEVGSGRGYLQDLADDYTGLDISAAVKPKYHKKFILGSATAMPIPDNSFDGGWSIWVWEHIPSPEQALTELRRVLRNGAVFYMWPAWVPSDSLAQGYRVRPASDFDWRGKLVKALVPVRESRPFNWAVRLPVRSVRGLAALAGPTALHYRLLQPNYETYWEADSDALNSIDRHEMMLWFRSRGDECLNCEGLAGSVLQRMDPLVIRIRK